MKKLATYFSYFGAGVALALSAGLEVASSMGTNEVVEKVEADLSMRGRLGARSRQQHHRSPCSAASRSRSAGSQASGEGAQSMWAQRNFETSSWDLLALHYFSSVRRQKYWLGQSLQAF